MISTFQRMRELFPELNRYSVTEKMVRRASRSLDTPIFYEPLNLDGYFIPASISLTGKQAIYLNSKATIERQIASAVHEMTHAAVHTSSGSILCSHRLGLTDALYRDRERLRSLEFDAYAISAIALIPLQKLMRASRGLFEAEDEFIEDLWQLRIQIFNLYKI